MNLLGFPRNSPPVRSYSPNSGAELEKTYRFLVFLSPPPLFRVPKIEFFENCRKPVGVGGPALRPKITPLGPSIRPYKSRAPTPRPARDTAIFRFFGLFSCRNGRFGVQKSSVSRIAETGWEMKGRCFTNKCSPKNPLFTGSRGFSQLPA